MSIAFYPQSGLICFGSEQAATKAGLTAMCPNHDQIDFDLSIRDSDVDRDATRLDLDDLGGEVVLLDFGDKNEGPKSRRRVASKPSRYLPLHRMMKGAVSMVIYQVGCFSSCGYIVCVIVAPSRPSSQSVSRT
jgi:hypothetical protein